MLRFLAVLSVVGAGLLAGGPAHSDSRTYFSFSTSVGGPGHYRHGHSYGRHSYYAPHRYWGPRYYEPRITYYYPPPPVYYAPPPVVYAPPPAVVYAPPPVVVVPRQTCQVFRGDAVIDSSGSPFHGTACLRADGKWHIVD